MKRLKIRAMLFSFVLASVNFLSIDLNSNSNDLNLDTLIKVALADGESGGLTCNCVSCPGDESGCWSYDYSVTGCGGANSGYTGSWQCEGAGKIEKHVIDCNGPC
ncbi:MAG: hypothetical protein AB2L20_30525 [Mangrovibacterium sp.]